MSFLFSSCNLQEKKKFEIGVSQCSDDMWRKKINDEMKREASFHQDVFVNIKTVKDDTQQQVKDIEFFIEEKVDLLIISPNESSALTPVIEKAIAANIPVILLDRKIDTNNYTAYIGGDNYQLAKELALYVVGKLKGEGNIFIMRGWEGSTADKERYEGFSEIINKYPNIHIVGESYGNFLTQTSEQEMAKFIGQDTPIDLVYAMNDPMAYGVHRAFTKSRKESPFIIGIDALAGDSGGMKAIEDGVIDASFMYPTGGDKVMELAYKILNKDSFNKDNILYTTVVDKNNARVLQLQHNQIYEQEEKFDRVNLLLNKSNTKYSNQQSILYMSLVAVFLISVLLLIAYIAYRSKNEANLLLEKKNDEITKQSKTLEKQKDELVSLSKQLEDATHAKLVFFTNISHEFKTPLSLILGPIDLLLDMNQDEQQRELLLLIKRNSNRLLRLISEIIEFRSFENHKIHVHFTKNDLRTFVGNITSYFDGFIKQKKIDVQVDVEDTSFLMWFDKEKIEKTYYNLLSNAFKHVEKGGTIKIQINKIQINGSDFAELLVFNSGSYIPMEEQNNIFDRFYVMENTMGGTGIGLALCSAMVELHKGSISVTSKSNEGTTFKMLLPFEQAENTENTEQSTTYQIGSYSESKIEEQQDGIESVFTKQYIKDSDKPLILIIEDNLDMRRFMHISLSKEYNIIEAIDGEDGIEKAIKYTPDLIISDVMMPKKNGYEVCRTLRDNLSTSHIPIIILTACSQDEEKSIGFESGADAYIPKPFNESLLKIRVRKLIENRQRVKDVFGLSLVNNDKKESLAVSEQNFIDSFTFYVEKNISNPELNVDDISIHVGLSKSQLNRKLKSLTNYSPNELVRIIRLKYAKHLLITGHMSISEIAYESGFSSPSYFTKCFKDFFNENPSDLQNK